MNGKLNIGQKKIFLGPIYVLLFIGTMIWAASPSISDDFTNRRITAGAKIFRALLAADVDIVRKTGSNGELRLCLLYIDDTTNAEIAADTLHNRGDPRIRKMKTRIEILSFVDCFADVNEQLAGVFLTQRLNAEQLKDLTVFANAHHLVVFSPFEGDVERGVQSGIAVEARVRPYLNMDALQNAQVRLKPFFLKVAKAYEN